MKKNISILNDCYGCGVCVAACPVNIIKLCENNDGFYSPVIDEQNKCIECGRCLKVCAFNHNEVAQHDFEIVTYASWSKDGIIRARCSSGGLGFEIGKKLIEEGYKAVGVRYNPSTERAEHFIADSTNEFMPSVGSKYIPSDTTVFRDIDPKQRYLVTGTPCQIDSFRRYIQLCRKEDNFVLMDFFCHGVPTLHLWDKYLTTVKRTIGNVTFASWRNKSTGWHDSWSIQADTDPSELNYHTSYDLTDVERPHLYSSRMSDGDLFYKFFLGNYCLNKCCYKTCKYKMQKSAADIRIGDLWGSTFAKNQEGVTATIAFTPKGKDIISSLQARCDCIHIDTDTAMEGQMRHNAILPPIRDKIIKALAENETLEKIDRTIIERYRRRFIPGRIANRILRLLRIKPIFRSR